MNAKQFYDTVKEMRRAQKMYFTAVKMKDQEKRSKWFAESIRLERTVDSEIIRADAAYEKFMHENDCPK